MDENSMMLRFYIGILHANLDIINKNKKQGKGTVEESRPEGSYVSAFCWTEKQGGNSI